MMSVQVFKDKEIVWFYGIVMGILGFTFILVFTDHEVVLSLVPLIFIIGFAYFGWPIKVAVNDNVIVFKGLLRRVKLTPDSIVSVRIVGAYDYRAHIVLRNKHELPIGYRCRQYTDASALASAVLAVVDKSPKAKVQPDARKLLQQIVKGVVKPLR